MRFQGCRAGASVPEAVICAFVTGTVTDESLTGASVTGT